MTAYISPYVSGAANKIQAIIAAAPEYVRAGYAVITNQAIPKIVELAHRTHALWIQLLPYMKAGLIFCVSPIGISIAILGLSTLPLRISRSSTSNVARIAWFTLGILTACYGTYLLSTTGVIPAFTFIQLS